MPNQQRQQQHPPREHEHQDHPGVYQVRPDRNTTMIAAAALAVFAWFANNWANRVETEAEQARTIATQAQQINEQQTQLLQTLPDRLDQMMKSAVQPLQQRFEDYQSRMGDAYTREAAQRDLAEQNQAMASLRQEINANQSTISTTSGRVDSLEKSLTEVNRRLEQIYQAVITGNRSTASFMRPIFQTTSEGPLYEY